MRSTRSIFSTSLLFLSFASASHAETFTNPVTIEPSVYGPKLILNDANVANKVPLEFRSNDAVKWEIGQRPAAENTDLVLWRFYNGSYIRSMTWSYLTGNVGIGNSFPAGKFHVDADDMLGDVFIFEGNNTNPAAGMNFTIRSTSGAFPLIQLENNYLDSVWNLENGRYGVGDFSFYKNGIGTVALIDGEGKFGIGTTSPSARLDVYDSTMLGSSVWDATLLSRSAGNTGNKVAQNLWLVRDAAGSDWYTARLHDGISVDNSFLAPGTTTRTWWERDPNSQTHSWGSRGDTYMELSGYGLNVNGAIKSTVSTGSEFYGIGLRRSGSGGNPDLWPNNGDRLVLGGAVGNLNQLVLKSDGRVGIGTSTLDQVFNVSGTAKVGSMELNGGGAYLGFNSYYSSGWKHRANGYGAAFRFDAGGHFQFYTSTSGTAGGTANLTEKMRISNSGNVGIGTSTPDNKLDVKGTIRAEEVIVETGWSDYVFEDGYTLQSLSEVEAHIAQHGHLPGMPSAIEVAEKGLSLGDSQRLLLEKVEELTLYAIEKDKRIAELEGRLERLEAMLVGSKN